MKKLILIIGLIAFLLLTIGVANAAGPVEYSLSSSSYSVNDNAGFLSVSVNRVFNNTCLVNPGFESLMSGWTNNTGSTSITTWTATTSSPHSGTYCAHVAGSFSAGGWYQLTSSTHQDVTNGQTVIIDFWLKTASAGASYQANLMIYDSGDSYIGQSSANTFTTSASWTHYTYTVTISQAGAAKIAFEVGPAAAGAFDFYVDDVSITTPTTSTGRVSYATSDGTAQAGYDYTATSGTLTFASGETSKTFTVPITYRSAYYGNRAFTVSLSSPVNGTIGTITATATIIDTHQSSVPSGTGYTYVYVSNQNSNSISVIDPVTLSKVSDIKTRSAPSDVFLNPAGTQIYVVYDASPYCDIFNAADYSLAKSIKLTNGLNNSGYTRMAMNEQGTRLYISLMQENCVIAIDMTTNTIIGQKYLRASYTGGANPIVGAYGIYYLNGYLYLCEYFDRTVEKINAITLESMKVYGATYTGDTVTGSNGAFYLPATLDYDSYLKRIIIKNNNHTATSIWVENDTVSAMFLTGQAPVYATSGGGVAVNNTGYVYITVSEQSVNNVTVFNPYGTIIKNITMPTGTTPTAIKNDPYNSTLFFTGRGTSSLYVIDSQTVNILGYITVGSVPFRLSIGTQVIPATTVTTFYTKTAFDMVPVSDVNVSVYSSSNLLLYTATTDSNGAVSFYMNPTYTYKLLFNQSPNINQWYNVTPVASSYTVHIPFTQVLGLSKWSDGILDTRAEYATSWSLTTGFNTSSGIGTMNVSYVDVTASSAGFFLYKNASEWDGGDQLIAQILDSSAPFYTNFTIGGATGNSYYIVIKSNTTDGAKTYSSGLAKHFPGPRVLNGVLPAEWLFWIAFFCVLALFSMGTLTRKGFIGVIGAVGGVIFTEFGWYELYFPREIAYPALGFVFIISFVVILIEHERYK